MRNSTSEPNTRLLTEQRRQRIMDLLNERGTITAEELVNSFKVSQMTVWRDLTVLEETGKLRRIRGGAIQVENGVGLEPFYVSKRVVNRAKKDAIAQYAVENFVDDNDIIILEAGTTVASMIKFLNRRNLTLISNGLGIINEATPSIPDITLMGCGGILRDVSQTFVGPQAVRFFQGLRAKTFFLGASGFAFPEGITDPSPLEIEIKQAMAASAERVVVLIDSTKFGLRSLSTILPLDAIHALITDSSAPGTDLDRLRKLGIDVRVAASG